MFLVVVIKQRMMIYVIILIAKWKGRFPILRDLRLDLEFAQKAIIATAILENMARLWGEEEIEGDGDEADENNGNGDVVHNNAEDTVRRRGQLVRDNMLRNMPA